MSQTLDIRAFSAFGLPAQGDTASRAPPIVVARRASATEAEAPAAAKIEAIDVSGLGLPPRRPRRAFGLGAVASIALHGSFVLSALLWSQSQIERAPEPLAVEIVVERVPDPAPPAPEPHPPALQPPVAEVAPPSEASPPPPPSTGEPPPPEPIPTPVVVETPPPPMPEPSTVAVAEPPPVVETAPPPKPTPTPITKVEPPKPTPAPKKAERPAPAKPKPTPKPATSLVAPPSEANQSRTAAPAASGANVGDYVNSVYARIQARQHYPDAARETGAHGTAVVSFVLDESGQLRSVAILQSSGDAVLDADALATVRRSAPFGPPPPGARREYPVKLRYHLQ